MSRWRAVSHHVLPSATAPIPTAHETPIANTGSGPASAASGSAISMHAAKHAVIGWRGRRRAGVRAPTGGATAPAGAAPPPRARNDPPVAGAVERAAEDRRPEHDERGEAEVRKGEADDRRPHPGSR